MVSMAFHLALKFLMKQLFKTIFQFRVKNETD